MRNKKPLPSKTSTPENLPQTPFFQTKNSAKKFIFKQIPVVDLRNQTQEQKPCYNNILVANDNQDQQSNTIPSYDEARMPLPQNFKQQKSKKKLISINGFEYCEKKNHSHNHLETHNITVTQSNSPHVTQSNSPHESPEERTSAKLKEIAKKIWGWKVINCNDCDDGNINSCDTPCDDPFECAKGSVVACCVILIAVSVVFVAIKILQYSAAGLIYLVGSCIGCTEQDPDSDTILTKCVIVENPSCSEMKYGNFIGNDSNNAGEFPLTSDMSVS